MTIAILVYGSMHLYAFGKVWMAFPHTPVLATALILAGAILTFSPFIVWYLEKQNWHDASAVAAWASYSWMGFLFLFFCIALVFDLGHLLAALMSFKWPLDKAVALLTTVLLSLSAFGYGLLEARQIRIEEVNIPTPKLVTGSVTIAQISDLHLGRMLGNDFLDRVLAKLREVKPDIVVATGDIVDGEGDGLDALAQQFRGYIPSLGAYAVIGNHEHYVGLDNSIRFLRNSGFTVLRGESAATGGIILAGIDDPGARDTDHPAILDARKALASATAKDFIVLLKHQPVIDADIPFDLQLSGHIHGGQIFPFVYLTRLVYGVHTGLTQLADGRLLYVNRGTGTWGPPIRLFAPPEITLIRITSTRQ